MMRWRPDTLAEPKPGPCAPVAAGWPPAAWWGRP